MSRSSAIAFLLAIRRLHAGPCPEGIATRGPHRMDADCERLHNSSSPRRRGRRRNGCRAGRRSRTTISTAGSRTTPRRRSSSTSCTSSRSASAPAPTTGRSSPTRIRGTSSCSTSAPAAGCSTSRAEFAIGAPCLMTVPVAAVHRIRFQPETDGWVVTAAEPFVAQAVEGDARLVEATRCAGVFPLADTGLDPEISRRGLPPASCASSSGRRRAVGRRSGRFS